jgi:hypothetical protein
MAKKFLPRPMLLAKPVQFKLPVTPARNEVGLPQYP